ncbi:MAG: hypothetical protein ABI910_20860 [Gemmatimonadota bacterium]
MHLLEHELYLVSGDDADPRRRHAGACAECAARVEGARSFERTLPALLRRLDRSASDLAPTLTTTDVIALARQRVNERAARRRRAFLGGLATLAAASAAAAAIPTARWHALIERLTLPASTTPHRLDSPPSAGPAQPAAMRGSIAFAPSPAVTLSFRFVQAAGAIRIVLTDSRQIRVEHSGGTPTYVLSQRGVAVENSASSASYVIDVPRTTDAIEVRIAGRLVFAKLGASVTGIAETDGPDAYHLNFNSLSRSVP